MKNVFSCGDILLPDIRTAGEWQKWSVIACDQFTSQPEYWEKAAELAGDSPSALKLILPEAYLEDDPGSRIEKIHGNMKKYLSDGIFREYKDSFVYTERMTSDGLRCGIVGCIDLEGYDYRPDSTSAVRATEETVPSRIPPRIKVRRGAPLELPHIMILINDPGRTVIEPLADRKASLEKLYDFELMQGGGNIAGYLLNGDTAAGVTAALDRLSEGCGESGFVFAVGDGNHSLATAKEYYEELKRNNPGEDLSGHPARYALAEIVNLHSPAIRFEGIHRIVFDTDTDSLMEAMKSALGLVSEEREQGFTAVINGREEKFFIGEPISEITVGSVQKFLDSYIAANGGSIDYIHGAGTVRELAARKNGIGIILPDMKKEELFPAVEKGGSLPRKTFSMGHAEDKRYYIEARAILRNPSAVTPR